MNNFNIDGQNFIFAFLFLKAFVGFKGDHNIPPDYTPAIATGNWGCGAFKGDPLLKGKSVVPAPNVMLHKNKTIIIKTS